jgi:hypothetical protein
MKTLWRLPVALGLVLLAAPAWAVRPHISCNTIRTAIESGKSEEQVAKEMRTTMKRVKHCTTQHGSAATK